MLLPSPAAAKRPPVDAAFGTASSARGWSGGLCSLFATAPTLDRFVSLEITGQGALPPSPVRYAASSWQFVNADGAPQFYYPSEDDLYTTDLVVSGPAGDWRANAATEAELNTADDCFDTAVGCNGLEVGNMAQVHAEILDPGEAAYAYGADADSYCAQYLPAQICFLSEVTDTGGSSADESAGDQEQPATTPTAAGPGPGSSRFGRLVAASADLLGRREATETSERAKRGFAWGSAPVPIVAGGATGGSRAYRIVPSDAECRRGSGEFLLVPRHVFSDSLPTTRTVDSNLFQVSGSGALTASAWITEFQILTQPLGSSYFRSVGLTRDEPRRLVGLAQPIAGGQAYNQAGVVGGDSDYWSVGVPENAPLEVRARVAWECEDPLAAEIAPMPRGYLLSMTGMGCGGDWPQQLVARPFDGSAGRSFLALSRYGFATPDVIVKVIRQGPLRFFDLPGDLASLAGGRMYGTGEGAVFGFDAIYWRDRLACVGKDVAVPALATVHSATLEDHVAVPR